MYFVPYSGHAKVYETFIWTLCFQILAKTMMHTLSFFLTRGVLFTGSFKKMHVQKRREQVKEYEKQEKHIKALKSSGKSGKVAVSKA